jgi:hypothetical protein
MRRWARSGSSPRAIRLRLTLLYASLFVVFGAVLLGISYVVVRAQFTGTSDVKFVARALQRPMPGPMALPLPDDEIADTLITGLQ